MAHLKPLDLVLWTIVLTSGTSAGISDMDSPTHDKVVVCYLATWAAYRTGNGAFKLDSFDPSLCTHLVYAFAGLDEATDSIKSLDKWQDLADDYGLDGYQRATGLKVRYPHLKVTLAIGGWNEGSEKYSKLAAVPERRQKFIRSVVTFLKKYGFDGLDLDWEYPAKRGGIPDDKKNFVSLVKELKSEFKKHNYLLTAAFGASKATIDSSYDVSQLSQYLDFIHMMCYDFHGTWDGLVGPNAPLYDSPNGDTLSSEFTINYMLSLGAPPEKLVMGIPLYGRTFIRENDEDHSEPPRFGVTKVKPAGFQGPYTKENGFMGYNEICEEVLAKSSDWTYMWDTNSSTPFAYNGEKVVTFDDQRSVAEKVRFAINKNLKGVMVWSVDTDDFKGNCVPISRIFDDFEDRLKAMKSNPFFNKIVNDLKLPTSTEEELKTSRLTDSKWYRMVNGILRLIIPERTISNFPLMRTIDESILLSKQEQDLMNMLENNIKQKEEENEIPSSSGRIVDHKILLGVCLSIFLMMI